MTEEPAEIEFGVNTFGEITADADGIDEPAPTALRHIVDEAVLADAVGLQHFGVGEHHRDDFAVSAPDVVLAAAAGRTHQITLGSAVVVLSSDDPVRVYQRWATLDAVSGGRAELTVGRGSFTESFPLFGLDLADYDVLFSERLDLLVQLQREGPVTWSGTTRSSLNQQRVYPPTAAGRLPIVVGVGGSPDSVVRAAKHGLPITLAVIGGEPMRFAPFVDLYRRATDQFGHGRLPVGVHSGGYVAESDQHARDEYLPYYRAGIDRIGRERGWPPLTAERYDGEIEHGSLYVGGPDTVAEKIARTLTGLDVQRFDMKYSAGRLPHAAMLRSIELFGSEVVPRVRKLLAAAE
jgi:probable LLM family oxidoreductase